MAKKLSLEEIEQFVKDTLENPENLSAQLLSLVGRELLQPISKIGM